MLFVNVYAGYLFLLTAWCCYYCRSVIVGKRDGRLVRPSYLEQTISTAATLP